MQLKSESYTSKAEAIPMMENSNFIKFRFTHLCSAFGFYLLAINFSLFIREALGFEVINVGNLLKMIKLISLACFTFILSCYSFYLVYVLKQKTVLFSLKIVSKMVHKKTEFLFFLKLSDAHICH